MILLDGKLCSQQIRQRISEQVHSFIADGNRAPHLGIIQVGTNPASTTYVDNKQKACEEVGIRATVLRLPEDTTQEQLLTQIDHWNKDPQIDGFIVQLPLPASIQERVIIEAIIPEKDVDGFNPLNQGRLMLGMDAFLPATPTGIISLLESYHVPFQGKHCVIIGRSNIVGRPVANLLSQKGRDCTITLCHSKTQNLKSITQRADIIVIAIGSPRFLTADMVPEGCTVIDVGINRIPADTPKGYRIVGDVDFENVAPKCAYISPVPGGCGLMTIVSLLQNTLKAYCLHAV